jgi:hypothetical protein
MTQLQRLGGERPCASSMAMAQHLREKRSCTSSVVLEQHLRGMAKGPLCRWYQCHSGYLRRQALDLHQLYQTFAKPRKGSE